MSYEEAMRRYGSDKPDLRNPLELIDVKDLLTDVDFKVFSAPANDPACRVTALRVPGGAKLSRGDIDKYTDFVKVYGARGLAYIRSEEHTSELQSLMRISYAVFCLKKKQSNKTQSTIISK